MSIKRKLIAVLNKKISCCRSCPLHFYKTNYVFGDGNPDSPIMFIGEAPGANEDRQGKPFVGPAGQILTRMIKNVLRISRENVYITNVIKCRPPNNRRPTDFEIEICSRFLDAEIEIIRPKIIVALGSTAAKYMFMKKKKDFSVLMNSIHGKLYFTFINGQLYKFFVTYHPAAALYKKEILRILENDFIRLRNMLKAMKII